MNECGRAFQVREVCTDFEELRGFQVVCWRENVLMKDPVAIEEAVVVGGGTGSGM